MRNCVLAGVSVENALLSELKQHLQRPPGPPFGPSHESLHEVFQKAAPSLNIEITPDLYKLPFSARAPTRPIARQVAVS